MGGERGRFTVENEHAEQRAAAWRAEQDAARAGTEVTAEPDPEASAVPGEPSSDPDQPESGAEPETAPAPAPKRPPVAPKTAG